MIEFNAEIALLVYAIIAKNFVVLEKFLLFERIYIAKM